MRISQEAFSAAMNLAHSLQTSTLCERCCWWRFECERGQLCSTAVDRDRSALSLVRANLCRWLGTKLPDSSRAAFGTAHSLISAASASSQQSAARNKPPQLATNHLVDYAPLLAPIEPNERAAEEEEEATAAGWTGNGRRTRREKGDWRTDAGQIERRTDKN